jgi:hypothetical protein
MHYELGDLARSFERQTEALAEFRALDDASRAVTSLQNLAQIHLDRAELAAARAALDESLESSRRIGDRAGEGYALKALADLELERGDRELARRRYEEALAIYRAAGQESWVRLTEMSLAVLARDAGRRREAEAELARLAGEFERAGAVHDRDEAALQRLRALVAGERAGEAARASAELLARAVRSDSRRVRHLARLADAELALAAGDLGRARRALAADLEESRRGGFALQALEVRVLEARAAERAGDARAAGLREAALAEARRLGCGRLIEELGAARLASESTAGRL